MTFLLIALLVGIIISSSLVLASYSCTKEWFGENKIENMSTTLKLNRNYFPDMTIEEQIHKLIHNQFNTQKILKYEQLFASPKNIVIEVFVFHNPAWNATVQIWRLLLEKNSKNEIKLKKKYQINSRDSGIVRPINSNDFDANTNIKISNQVKQWKNLSSSVMKNFL